MQIIALINQKGGVGKTTCAINIGAGLNKLGKRVLLIDLDPQAHLTYSLGIPAHELNNILYSSLRKSEKEMKTFYITFNPLFMLDIIIITNNTNITNNTRITNNTNIINIDR